MQRRTFLQTVLAGSSTLLSAAARQAAGNSIPWGTQAKTSENSAAERSEVPVYEGMVDSSTGLTFANFLPGRSNQQALIAARRLASESTGDVLLFIQSEVGHGKTHLTRAI